MESYISSSEGGAVFGVWRDSTPRRSTVRFFLNSKRYSMVLPRIYMYIGHRLTQMNHSSASVFRTVVDEIGEEIWGGGGKRPHRIFVFTLMAHKLRTINALSVKCFSMRSMMQIRLLLYQVPWAFQLQCCRQGKGTLQEKTSLLINPNLTNKCRIFEIW